MSKHKTQASFKAVVDLNQAIKYLEDVIQSLKAGTISVTNCEESVTLTPENLVKLGFEATQKTDRESLKLTISWRKEEVPDDSARFTISAQAPEPAPQPAPQPVYPTPEAGTGLS